MIYLDVNHLREKTTWKSNLFFILFFNQQQYSQKGLKKIKIYNIIVYVRIKDCDTVKKLTYLLFLLLIIPIKVGAIHEVIDSRCTNSLKAMLRNEGQEVAYRFSKVKNGEDVTYTIYFYNLTENMYMTDSSGNIYTTSKIEKLTPGSSFVINFYASSKTYCEGYKIYSKIISVPYYNPYFGSDLCKGYENYSLCKENVNITISQEEFEKKLSFYKESLKEEDNVDIVDDTEENEEKSLYEIILNYKYYFIFGLCFLVSSVIIVIIVKEVKKRKSGGIL